MPDQPTDAGRDNETAKRLLSDLSIDFQAGRHGRAIDAIALALSAARQEGAAKAKEQASDILLTILTAFSEFAPMATFDPVQPLATAMNLRDHWKRQVEQARREGQATGEAYALAPVADYVNTELREVGGSGQQIDKLTLDGVREGINWLRWAVDKKARAEGARQEGEDADPMFEQFCADLNQAHDGLMLAQGCKPDEVGDYDWPEWTPQANSIRWAEKRLGKPLGKRSIRQVCETCECVIAGFRDGVRYDKCANWSEPCADIKFCGAWRAREPREEAGR